MGISTILTAAMKRISWDQIATIAMQYGPDFLRKLKGQLQSHSASEHEATVTVDLLGERIEELEQALIRQEEAIEQQNKTIELLEENGKTLQARLTVCMVISAFSVLLSLVLLMFLLRR